MRNLTNVEMAEWLTKYVNMESIFHNTLSISEMYAIYIVGATIAV